MLRHRLNQDCRVLATTLLLFLGQFTSSCFGDVSETELKSILATIRSSRAKVKSARIEVRTRTHSDVPESLLFKTSRLVELTQSTAEFAFRDDQRYLKTTKTSRPFRDPAVPQAKRISREVPGAKSLPGAKAAKAAMNVSVVTHVFDGEKQYVTRGNLTELIARKNFQERPSFFFDLPYLRGSSWYIPDPTGPTDLDEKRQTEFFPHGLDAGRVSAKRERLDGKEMLLIEKPAPGKGIEERIWLDPDVGWMVARREFASTGTNGRVLARLRMSNPVQVLGNFWIPGKIEVEEYAPEAAVAEYGKDRPWVVTTFEAAVKNVNDVDSAVFVPKLKPGSLVVDVPSISEGFKVGASVPTRQVDADGKIIDDSP